MNTRRIDKILDSRPTSDGDGVKIRRTLGLHRARLELERTKGLQPGKDAAQHEHREQDEGAPEQAQRELAGRHSGARSRGGRSGGRRRRPGQAAPSGTNT